MTRSPEHQRGDRVDTHTHNRMFANSSLRNLHWYNSACPCWGVLICFLHSSFRSVPGCPYNSTAGAFGFYPNGVKMQTVFVGARLFCQRACAKLPESSGQVVLWPFRRVPWPSEPHAFSIRSESHIVLYLVSPKSELRFFT